MPGGRLPNRQDLDAIVSDRPVFLAAYDGHTGWANSAALGDRRGNLDYIPAMPSTNSRGRGLIFTSYSLPRRQPLRGIAPNRIFCGILP